MNEYFIIYMPQGSSDPLKRKVMASNAARALVDVDWPKSKIFTLYQYLDYDTIDRAIRGAPTDKIFDFQQWEVKYGSASSPRHLWVDPKTRNPGERIHPAVDGRHTIRLCALTGHVRWPSIAEYHGSWTAPKVESSHQLLEIHASATGR